MCGRFILSHTTEEVAERFKVQEILFELTPRFNIAPTQPVPVIRQNGSRVLDGFR
jgi:putative SOS response-associated peptidase YedK